MAEKQIARVQEENSRNFNKKRTIAHVNNVGDLCAIVRKIGDHEESAHTNANHMKRWRIDRTKI